MKFYLTYSPEDGVLGCATSKAKAVKFATDLYGRGAAKRGARVDCVLVFNMRDAVRRLLGNHGGYASDITTVWPANAADNAKGS
jgi:hypothetical protein